MLSPNLPSVNDTQPQDHLDEAQWRTLRAKELLVGACALLAKYPDTALSKLCGEAQAEIANVQELLATFVAVTAEAQRAGVGQ